MSGVELTKKQAYMKSYRAQHGVRLREAERQRRLNNPELTKLNDRKSYQKHRLQKLATKRAYHIKNRRKRNAYSRSYWAANKVKLSADSRQWYLDNQKYAIKQATAYVSKNPEKHKAYQLAWRKRNPAKWHAKEARRRALEKGAVTDRESVEWFFTVIRNQDTVTCSYCGKDIDALKAHVDHIVPLSCGGDHLPDNFAVACPTCNLSKHNHLLQEWKRCPARIKQLWLEYFQKNV